MNWYRATNTLDVDALSQRLGMPQDLRIRVFRSC